jgi:hypothetical protein
MKSTDLFKQVIKQHLDNRAATDKLFAKVYASENKNIDECCTYIINQVQKLKVNAMAEDEVYNLAVHYYDEANLEVGAVISKVNIVSPSIELTEEEIRELREQAREEAIKTARAEAIKLALEEMRKPKAKQPVKPVAVQSSLFDEE